MMVCCAFTNRVLFNPVNLPESLDLPPTLFSSANAAVMVKDGNINQTLLERIARRCRTVALHYNVFISFTLFSPFMLFLGGGGLGGMM